MSSQREDALAPEKGAFQNHVKRELSLLLFLFIIHYMYYVKSVFPSPRYPEFMAGKKGQPSSFSRNVRRLRKERGLSQYDLAERTGLSQRMIHHYESYASEPPLSKLELLAKALKVRASALLENPTETISVDASQFDTRSLKKLRDILELPPGDRSFLYRTLSNLTRKNQLERATRNGEPPAQKKADQGP